MANAEHLEILKSGVEKWNKWREENASVVPDLSRANLSNFNLSGINLSATHLVDADLSGANLSNANLVGSRLSNTDLTGTNLSGANLKNAYLPKANLEIAILREAQLEQAYLYNVNLNQSDISRASLKGADLRNTDLRGAILSETNLSSARLELANLTGAFLDKTNFESCHLGMTIFGLTNLYTCLGLDKVQTILPCTIDFQTLQASKKIPKPFLVKLGLPELYIDYLPDFFHNVGVRLFSAFLSHSFENKPFARKLYEALIAKGVNVFFDEKKLKPGDNLFDSLSRGIDLYDKTILVCSKDSLNSWWVDQELEMVMEKERNLQIESDEKTGLLIPITIDDHIYTWKGGKQMAIKNRIIGDFTKWEDDVAFEKALNDLIDALNVDRLNMKPPSYL